MTRMPGNDATYNQKPPTKKIGRGTGNRFVGSLAFKQTGWLWRLYKAPRS